MFGGQSDSGTAVGVPKYFVLPLLKTIHQTGQRYLVKHNLEVYLMTMW